MKSYLRKIGMKYVPIRSVNIDCFLFVVRNLAVDKLDRFVRFPQKMVALLIEIAIIVGSQNS